MPVLSGCGYYLWVRACLHRSLLQVLNSSPSQWKLHMFHAVGSWTTCRCLSSVTLWFCSWPLSVAASCFLALVSVFMKFCESHNLFLLTDQDVGEDCTAGVVFSSEDVSLTVLFLHFSMEFSTWWIMFLDDTCTRCPVLHCCFTFWSFMKQKNGYDQFSFYSLSLDVQLLENCP